jgi:hypothetical protein
MVKQVALSVFLLFQLSANAHEYRDKAEKTFSEEAFKIPGDFDRARSLIIDMAAKSFDGCEKEGSSREKYFKELKNINSSIEKADKTLSQSSLNSTVGTNLLVIKSYLQSLKGKCEKNLTLVSASIVSLKKALEKHPGNPQALSFVAYLILKLDKMSLTEKAISATFGGPTASKVWAEFRDKLLMAEQKTELMQKAIALMQKR